MFPLIPAARLMSLWSDTTGKLVKGSGASYYKLPENLSFKSVTIWCKAFNEFIMSADFESLKNMQQTKADQKYHQQTVVRSQLYLILAKTGIWPH